MGSTIREGGTQHWAGKALSLSNERWLKRARGAALKRDRSNLHITSVDPQVISDLITSLARTDSRTKNS